VTIDITADGITGGVMPPWCAGDEVYGRSSELRKHLEPHGVGYVLRVGAAFHLTLPTGQKVRVDVVATKHLKARKRWQVCSVAGSKGERAYAWAWMETGSPHHYLLIRKHLDARARRRTRLPRRSAQRSSFSPAIGMVGCTAVPE
jgi:hypothetical protein